MQIPSAGLEQISQAMQTVIRQMLTLRTAVINMK